MKITGDIPFGTRMRLERVYQKKTIQDVCDASGLGHGFVSDLETGKKTRVTLRTLRLLSRFYGTDILRWALKGGAVDNGKLLELLKLLRTMEDKDSE